MNQYSAACAYLPDMNDAVKEGALVHTSVCGVSGAEIFNPGQARILDDSEFFVLGNLENFTCIFGKRGRENSRKTKCAI
jgi:hypothetical protein